MKNVTPCYLRAPLSALLIAASLLLPPAAAAYDQELARASFASQYQALNGGRAEPALTAEAAEALVDYPLSPWLTALRMRAALAADALGNAPMVRGFLQEAEDAGYARDLRRDLLNHYAKQQDWPSLRAVYREASANDQSRCQFYNARVAGQDVQGLAGDLALLWVKAEGDLPAACDAPLQWLSQQPAWTNALVAERARARLMAGDTTRAKSLIALITEPSMSAPLNAWASLASSRTASFAAMTTGPQAAVDPEGLADQFQRHARADVELAASQLPLIITQQNLGAETADRLTGHVAMILSWSRDPRAYELFRPLSAAALTDLQHEWRVRSALWQGDYSSAARWVAQMPGHLASQQRWRYWQGRSLMLSGQREEAKRILQPLAQEFDSFGLFAAWALGQTYLPPARAPAITPEVRKALATNSALRRAEEAYRAGMSSIASAEWRAALNSLPDDAKPALLAEASRWGWYAQAITTGTELRIFDDVAALYPRPYLDLVSSASQQAGVEESWIYSVMRRESAFRPDARSSADALGLLQLLPSTANLVARRNGLPQPSRADLLNPSRNIPLGALHLAEVRDKYNGNWLFGLAAYNAGPGALRRWFPPRDMEPDVWMENIPFNETRGYLQRILMHVAVYEHQETGKPVQPARWLPRIAAGG